jgi:hypothetical protein
LAGTDSRRHGFVLQFLPDSVRRTGNRLLRRRGREFAWFAARIAAVTSRLFRGGAPSGGGGSSTGWPGGRTMVPLLVIVPRIG